ncbi:30S ribosomal protein S12 methylthiotransferase RimO [Cardiobacterium valvarum]|uniref:Ribosomal protein uS12 methylthiotransferase RimO n=1 Tax=Cardiobacterium valvarum F0432 TaxID=797473 RepID=G9ZFI8_9GAMM|nr:30S ribosomal protein S12 methylthiotransferase RimO [Cardiobacterium valvarum]EHM53877.1 ribosomal protein S12 methylthiotransferase RimO [Cardiobacterium valvarum F0432]
MNQAPHQPTIGFVSLGCPKALVDSERILTQISADGNAITKNYDDADLVIVNTCGFINEAVAESLATIGEAIRENGKVIVTGCLGVQPEKIRAVHPSVLAITGPQAYESVMSAVHEHLPKPPYNPHLDLIPSSGLKLTPRHYAYLKIAEGCDHKCTFCIIPDLRGRLQSRPIGQVMREAANLVKNGVKELLIVAQDTAAYGADSRHQMDNWNGAMLPTRLYELAQELGQLDAWVRLHYVYPYPDVDALIPLMADGRILPYLDIPFQHASPAILKAMRRPGNSERVLERIRRWREMCPDLAIRSTFIVGFPGESEADFEELLDFIEAADINRAGCFAYSPVDGAAANALPGAVPEAVKEERRQRFMEKQAAISARLLADKVGDVLPVIIDSVDADSDSAIGRTPYDAPEIDGVVHISGVSGVKAGDIVHVNIDDSDAHDLFGSVY